MISSLANELVGAKGASGKAADTDAKGRELGPEPTAFLAMILKL